MLLQFLEKFNWFFISLNQYGCCLFVGTCICYWSKEWLLVGWPTFELVLGLSVFLSLESNAKGGTLNRTPTFLCQFKILTEVGVRNCTNKGFVTYSHLGPPSQAMLCSAGCVYILRQVQKMMRQYHMLCTCSNGRVAYWNWSFDSAFVL